MKKVIVNGYLAGVSELHGEGDITEGEFAELMAKKPKGNYRYNVSTSAWESFAPPAPEPEPVSFEDIATALEEIL